MQQLHKNNSAISSLLTIKQNLLQMPRTRVRESPGALKTALQTNFCTLAFGLFSLGIYHQDI